MQAFHCKLVPPRASFVQDSSAAEAAAMKQHAPYRQARIDQDARVSRRGGSGIPRVHSESASWNRRMKPRYALWPRPIPAIRAAIGMHCEIHPMPRGRDAFGASGRERACEASSSPLRWRIAMLPDRP